MAVLHRIYNRYLDENKTGITPKEVKSWDESSVIVIPFKLDEVPHFGVFVYEIVVPGEKGLLVFFDSKNYYDDETVLKYARSISTVAQEKRILIERNLEAVQKLDGWSCGYWVLVFVENYLKEVEKKGADKNSFCDGIDINEVAIDVREKLKENEDRF